MNKQSLVFWLFTLFLSAFILAAIFAAPLLRSSGLHSANFIYLAFSSVCHQIPERSYHLAGNPLAVCSRCLGVYAGFFTGILVYPLLPRQTVKWAEKRGYLIILTSIPLLIDAAGGILRLWISPLPLRSITGFVWAFSFPVYWFKALFELVMSRGKNERN